MLKTVIEVMGEELGVTAAGAEEGELDDDLQDLEFKCPLAISNDFSFLVRDYWPKTPYVFVNAATESTESRAMPVVVQRWMMDCSKRRSGRP